eukprot:COSAG06_NODE_5809_length_3262_cov_1.341132_3_plen_360_part_00
MRDDAPAAPRHEQWPSSLYYAVDTEVREAGTSELPELLARGTVDAYTLAWVETMEEWGALGEPSTLEHLGPIVDDEGVRQRLGDRASPQSPEATGVSPEAGQTAAAAERPVSPAAPESAPSTDEDSASPGSERQASPEARGAAPFCSVRYVDPSTKAPSDEVPVDTLRRALADGEVTAQGLVWIDGMDDWTPLCDCFERFGLVRAELGIMRQHMELQMTAASAAHRREIRTPVPGTDWDRVEVVEGPAEQQQGDSDEESAPEVFFVHRETGESAWELDPATAAAAAAAAAGIARPSSGGWLARENKTLCAENERLRKELEVAQQERAAAVRSERDIKRQLVAMRQENAALRSRLLPPCV